MGDLMRAKLAGTRSRLAAFRVVLLLSLVGGCAQEMDVGSDVLWSARFEGDSFAEWTSVAGGGVDFTATQNTMEVSSERAHEGSYSAKLTVYAPQAGTQGRDNFGREGNLPNEAYYSAWYYLPRSVAVGTYWVIMKFRMRSVVDDPASEGELFDLNLKTLSSGEMSLRMYDWQNGGGDLPLDVVDPVVSVGAWFQIEVFYRVASDNTGRFTLWLDGQQILDMRGPTGPTPWTAWDVGSIAAVLNPDTATIFVDDCAVSLSRVGPSGLIAP